MLKNLSLYSFYSLECLRNAVLNIAHILEKGKVFRTLNNWPLCEDCAMEYLGDNYWEDQDVEWVYEKTMSDFNGNYSKFDDWWKKNNVICPECECWVSKDWFLEDYGKCQACVEKEEEDLINVRK